MYTLPAACLWHYNAQTTGHTCTYMPIPFSQVLYDTEPMGSHLVRFTKLKKIMLNIVHMRNAVFKVF